MSEHVGSEAYSEVVRRDPSLVSRPCRFRAGEEREPVSEAQEARNKTLKAIDLAALSFPRNGHSWKLDGN